METSKDRIASGTECRCFAFWAVWSLTVVFTSQVM